MSNVFLDLEELKEKVSLAKNSNAKELRLNQYEYRKLYIVLENLVTTNQNKDLEIENLKRQLGDLKRRNTETNSSSVNGGYFKDLKESK